MKKSRRFVGMAVLIGALCLSACKGHKDIDYYEKGMQQLEKGKYKEAQDTLKEAVKGDFDLAASYRGLGIAALRAGDYKGAISAFSRSLLNLKNEGAAFEKDVQCYLALVRTLYGENEKAIKVYTEILDKYPEAQYYYLRGRCEIKEGNLERAKKDFDLAVKDSKDYDMYISIYEAYMEKNMEIDGTAYLDKALSLSVEEAKDYYNRGKVYYALKEYELAKADLIEAMNKGSADAMLLLGKVYISMGDIANARAMYKDYIAEHKEGALVYNGLALCDMEEGNYDSALENIEKGISLGQGNEVKSLLYNKVVVFEKKYDFANAQKAMADYLQIYPNDEKALRENAFLSTR